MNNRYIDLSDAEINAIRASFNSFKYYEGEKKKNYPLNHDEFISQAYYANDFFKELHHIMNVWGTSDINFANLELVFKSFLKNYPDKALNTFELFATIFELIAKILENRDFVNSELDKYSQLLKATDSYNSQQQYNSDLIFPNEAA